MAQHNALLSRRSNGLIAGAGELMIVDVQLFEIAFIRVRIIHNVTGNGEFFLNLHLELFQGVRALLGQHNHSGQRKQSRKHQRKQLLHKQDSSILIVSQAYDACAPHKRIHLYLLISILT